MSNAPGSTAAPKRFLDDLPEDRRKMMSGLRQAIRESLPRGYFEQFEGGMFTYEIPLSRYAHTHNKRPLVLAALTSKKSFVTLYLMAVYGDGETRAWFEKAYASSGKKLNMGRSCVHFRTYDDIPWDVIRQAIGRVPVDRYIEIYQAAQQGTKRR